MASDRDTLANLLLDCEETAASPRETADYLIERGWRPPAQEISSADALEALPDLSIVVIPNGLAVQKWHGDGVTWWIGASDSLVRLTSHRLISIWREVTLLHVPTEKAGTEPALNTLLGDQLIHSCVLPAVETHPHDVSVACACGRQWVRRGLIGWRPVEKASTE